MRWLRQYWWPVLCVLVIGVALPLLLVAGCDDASMALVSSDASCGSYETAWLDRLAITTAGFVGISSMAMGVPFLVVWSVIFAAALLVQRVFRMVF